MTLSANTDQSAPQQKDTRRCAQADRSSAGRAKCLTRPYWTVALWNGSPHKEPRNASRVLRMVGATRFDQGRHPNLGFPSRWDIQDATLARTGQVPARLPDHLYGQPLQIGDSQTHSGRVRKTLDRHLPSTVDCARPSITAQAQSTSPSRFLDRWGSTRADRSHDNRISRWPAARMVRIGYNASDNAQVGLDRADG